jgi:hypothetical protein
LVAANAKRTSEQRQADRAKAAAKRGKVYVPGRKGRGTLSAEELARRQVERDRASAERAAKRAEQRAAKAAAAPWLKPGLSGAEVWRLRYAHDPEYNIHERLRAAQRRKRQGYKIGDLLRDAIKRDGASPKVETLLGCGVRDLKTHLERQFTKGMTWPRFCAGDIHIDHIVPLNSFDLSNPDELRAAWAMSNLRPLWAQENLRKGFKRVSLL